MSGGTASNRAGATSDEIMVRPVTFGSIASFITSGMEAACGLWVGQLVIAFVPGLVIILVAVIKGNITPASFIVSGGLAPVMAFGFAALFNFTAGYWLALRRGAERRRIHSLYISYVSNRGGRVYARYARLLKPLLRVKKGRGRAKSGPAPHPLDNINQT